MNFVHKEEHLTSNTKRCSDGSRSAFIAALAKPDSGDRELARTQQRVVDAKTQGDADIDAHLRALNGARDDMDQRLGDAVAKINAAQTDVNDV